MYELFLNALAKNNFFSLEGKNKTKIYLNFTNQGIGVSYLTAKKFPRFRLNPKPYTYLRE